MVLRAIVGEKIGRLRAGTSAGGGGGPTPTLNLDFTSSLPGQVTFTRASTSKAIVGGVFTSLASGQPAIESWNSAAQGLRVNGAATNLSAGSNQLTNTTFWTAGSMTAVTVSAGVDLGPDGATVMTAMSETTANNTHQMTQTVSGITAGQTVTLSCFVRKPISPNTREGFGLRIAPQFNNNGAQAFFRIDGTMIYSPFATDATMTNVNAHMVNLGGGLYLCSLTATAVSAGTYTYCLHSIWEGNTNGCLPSTSYVGVVGQGPELSSVQFSTTSGAASYCDNPTTSGANVAAESAIFNDITWLSTSVGTLVVEHDCISGTVIGSGTNVVMAGQPLNFLTATAKTALAWDGTGSDLVNNGGATTAGATPTFGADVRLLSTSAATNFGHIKSIKYYPTRLTVSQCQTLTAPASTAQPGIRRLAARSCLPAHMDAASLSGTGTQFAFVSRVTATILGDRSDLQVDFANIAFPAISNANAVVIDGCALERVTGVAETVLFKFSGSQSFTLTAGSVNQKSDVMLPSQFTGITKFTSGDSYFLRIYYHVAALANTLPNSRQAAEPGATFWQYDSGVTAPDQPVTATGAITFSGAHSVPTRGMAPVLIGTSVSGDPKSAFIPGDSRVEGVSGPGGNISGYTFTQKACDALSIPSLAFCLGGSSQVTISGATWWYPYMGYTRILIDEMGTNNGNQLLQFAEYWVAAKKTYSVDKVIHTGLSPSTSSTDSWATAVNQTAVRALNSNMEKLWAFAAFSGQLDANQVFTSATIRDGTNGALWASNGTAFAFTQDGLHQSLTADGLMSTELQPTLSALVLT